MGKREVLNPQLLTQVVCYYPDTGLFVWKPRMASMFKRSGRYMLKSPEEACDLWNARFGLKEAFQATSKTGYKVSAIFGRQYYAHRVAFAIMTGRWPKVIDHKNRNRADNRWVNLRECSQSENTANRPYVGSKTSEFRGVSKKGKLWVARCKGSDVGFFKNECDAATAYNFAAFEEWGEFAILNKS